MDLNSRTYNYQTRLFLLIIVFTWILTFSFFTIQYTREKEYKIEEMNSRLQAFNKNIINNVNFSDSINTKFLKEISSDSIRITIIDLEGRVLYDSNIEGISENHASRNEISDALKYGSGYTLRRLSVSNNTEYFYSATKLDNLIVRSAVAYDEKELSAMLAVNTSYMWIIIIIALVLTVIAYYASKRVGQSITNLRDFTEKAKHGELSENDKYIFPKDELGEISSNIINLYKNLEKITRDRDESKKNLQHEAQEKERIKNQLTSNINHELKTPLHAIQASIETIVDNKDRLSKDQIVMLIDNCSENINRLIALIHDIATITSMNDPQQNIEMNKVNVNSIIDDIQKSVALLPEEKRMRLNISMPDKVEVYGNKGLIDAIFRNLVNNSIAYSGGRDIFIKVVNEGNYYYQFEVSDNGVGVSEEHLPRIFERFYRVDSGRSRNLGGTGLGLSIVRNSVIFHGGNISVESPFNGGLKFTFTLHK